jgi:hypothetical protein
MKLYLLSTKGLGDFYLVSKSPNDTKYKLGEMLDKADYGFRADRKINNIKLLADEIMNIRENTPNFSSGNKLILPDTCKNHK